MVNLHKTILYAFNQRGAKMFGCFLQENHRGQAIYSSVVKAVPPFLNISYLKKIIILLNDMIINKKIKEILYEI